MLTKGSAQMTLDHEVLQNFAGQPFKMTLSWIGIDL